MLDKLIKNSNWISIIQNYNVNTIADALPFKEAVTLAYRILYDKSWDEEIQNYATELLYAIRKNYNKEWNACWKLDVLLGMACEITMRYEEKYLAYKSASQKALPIPPSLKVLLAECYNSPGDPPISQQEAKNMLTEALNIEKTIEGVSSMLWICEIQENQDEIDYWNKVLKEVEQKNLHISGFCPSFLLGIV